jgi:alpha-L-fucosidase
MILAAAGQEPSKDALLDFVNTRYHAYFHYNMCTFKNLHSAQRHGRTHGDDPVSMWHPTGLDCDQRARVCKASLCIAEVVVTGAEASK